MRRLLLICIGIFGCIGLFVGPALAESPHFISNETFVVSVNSSGTTLTVHFKESGLAKSLNSVTIVTTANVECINGGSEHPKAANKTAESGSGTFDVSNGTAEGDETVTETNISPSCDPPMMLAWTDVVVHDYQFNDSISLPGTFFAGYTR